MVRFAKGVKITAVLIVAKYVRTSAAMSANAACQFVIPRIVVSVAWMFVNLVVPGVQGIVSEIAVVEIVFRI